MSLSAAEIEGFVERGFVYVRGALPRAFAEQWWAVRYAQLPQLADLWGPDNRHIYFPRLRAFDVLDVAPRLADAVADLVGADRLDRNGLRWGDGFVAAPPGQSEAADGPWHKDGFFRHYLDSSDVALVCVLLWTECSQAAGGTALAQGSVKTVVEALAARPRGMSPEDFEAMLPRDVACDYIEGESGDVCLLHPFLLHALRRNRTAQWRAITNPPVALRGGLRVRGDVSMAHLSPVEQAIRLALPKDDAPPRIAVDSAHVAPESAQQKVNRIRDQIERRLRTLHGVEP